MQNFHYKYIKNKYVDKVEMLLADTDSLNYKTFMKTSIKMKSYLTSVITQKIQNITVIQIT